MHIQIPEFDDRSDGEPFLFRGRDDDSELCRDAVRPGETIIRSVKYIQLEQIKREPNNG